jgi:hypothetical protein
MLPLSITVTVNAASFESPNITEATLSPKHVVCSSNTSQNTKIHVARFYPSKATILKANVAPFEPCSGDPNGHTTTVNVDDANIHITVETITDGALHEEKTDNILISKSSADRGGSIREDESSSSTAAGSNRHNEAQQPRTDESDVLRHCLSASAAPERGTIANVEMSSSTKDERNNIVWDDLAIISIGNGRLSKSSNDLKNPPRKLDRGAALPTQQQTLAPSHQQTETSKEESIATPINRCMIGYVPLNNKKRKDSTGDTPWLTNQLRLNKEHQEQTMSGETALASQQNSTNIVPADVDGRNDARPAQRRSLHPPLSQKKIKKKKKKKKQKKRDSPPETKFGMRDMLNHGTAASLFVLLFVILSVSTLSCPSFSHFSLMFVSLNFCACH